MLVTVCVDLVTVVLAVAGSLDDPSFSQITSKFPCVHILHLKVTEWQISTVILSGLSIK